MDTVGVDIHSTIFFRHQFASTLSVQSTKRFALLTNTPLIAEHLLHAAVSGAAIEGYARDEVQRLGDLGPLLRGLLSDDPLTAQKETAQPLPPSAGLGQPYDAVAHSGVPQSWRADRQPIPGPSLIKACDAPSGAATAGAAHPCLPTQRRSPLMVQREAAKSGTPGARGAARWWATLQVVLPASWYQSNAQSSEGRSVSTRETAEPVVVESTSLSAGRRGQATSVAPLWVLESFKTVPVLPPSCSSNTVPRTVTRRDDARNADSTMNGGGEDGRIPSSVSQEMPVPRLNLQLKNRSEGDNIFGKGEGEIQHDAYQDVTGLLQQVADHLSSTSGDGAVTAAPGSADSLAETKFCTDGRTDSNDPHLTPGCVSTSSPLPCMYANNSLQHDGATKAPWTPPRIALHTSTSLTPPSDGCLHRSGGNTGPPHREVTQLNTTSTIAAAAAVSPENPEQTLVGWLHLLVWVRRQVILMLRDLSGIQGYVAWSAWYWSWAQMHPRHAAFHEALSSISFWRGVWYQGLSTQYRESAYQVNGNMRTLKSIFRFIVSLIGAAYTSLDQLNTAIGQIQRTCEMATSRLAAAAAAAEMPIASAGKPSTKATVGDYTSGTSHTHHPTSTLQRGMTFLSQPSIVEFSVPLRSPRGRLDAGASLYGNASAQFAATTEVRLATCEEDRNNAFSAAVGELRNAVWVTLNTLQNMLSADVLEFEASPVSRSKSSVPHHAGGGSERGGAGMTFGSVSAFDEMLVGDVQPLLNSGLADQTVEQQEPTVRDGAVVLLHCAYHSERLVHQLNNLLHHSLCPPASRHWQRILVAAVTIIPPFAWLYSKKPSELIAMARSSAAVVRQVSHAYVLEPLVQLRNSLFYVRPGVEERRGAFDRDAISLANIIRDYHEDCYPGLSDERLNQLRDTTLERLRAGVADAEGVGLLERRYRRAVKHPIRSTIFGDLPRILLIQMSYQALEVSRVTNGIDEVLEGNDLNFKIMAIVPGLTAAGLLFLWSVFRYRANYRPLRIRMKLLWRAIHRVVSFAGLNHHFTPSVFSGVAPSGDRGAPDAYLINSPFGAKRSPTFQFSAYSSPHDALEGNGGETEAVREGDEDPHELPTQPTGAGSCDGGRSPRQHTRAGGTETTRRLNNYEQGMVLLLAHLMRCTVNEHLRSYIYLHELMEDLSDLESVESTQQQRLETLDRMRSTHDTLF